MYVQRKDGSKWAYKKFQLFRMPSGNTDPSEVGLACKVPVLGIIIEWFGRESVASADAYDAVWVVAEPWFLQVNI